MLLKATLLREYVDWEREKGIYGLILGPNITTFSFRNDAFEDKYHRSQRFCIFKNAVYFKLPFQVISFCVEKEGYLKYLKSVNVFFFFKLKKPSCYC